MIEHRCSALEADEPLAFLAAIGALSVLTRSQPATRLSWIEDGAFYAVLHLESGMSLVDLLEQDVERWRVGHAAVDFAVSADRKTQDLKAPPANFRSFMRSVQGDREVADFVAALATGVAVDGTGQTKPTSFHLCAGQQRFMDCVLSLRDEVNREDLVEAIDGPWEGRVGPKDLRWRSASERSRALLSFDPSKEKATTVVGAVWLAFQALPLFPASPVGRRIVTTGFTGSGKNERFAWPVWSDPLARDEISLLLGTRDLVSRDLAWRVARGVSAIFECAVSRSSQGYGNFSASRAV